MNIYSIYIYHEFQPNVGKYFIHGSYGIYWLDFSLKLNNYISGKQNMCALQIILDSQWGWYIGLEWIYPLNYPVSKVNWP